LEYESDIVEYFSNHYRDYLKFALTITHNLEGAQDVLQNVALVLCRKADELKNLKSPAGYLTVCVRRAALDYLRSVARMSAADPNFFANLHSNASECAQSYIEWVMVLEKHLEHYPEEMRKAFIAFYLDGYALEQVAAQVGLSVNALSQQFKRMRMRLAKQAPMLSTLIMLLSTM
jgi:RNA polymerase sigma factor (sigma-70 family)